MNSAITNALTGAAISMTGVTAAVCFMWGQPLLGVLNAALMALNIHMLVSNIKRGPR